MNTTLSVLPTPQGLLIPPHLLAAAGIKQEAEITVENHALILRAPTATARQGWAEASRAIAAAGDDALVWPDFPNDGDDEWQW